MSRKIIANPYSGEKLKEPLIVAEDHVIHPEDFYGLEVEENTDTIEKAVKEWKNACHNTFPDEELVNHPSHYQSYNTEIKIECIDAMRAAFGDETVKDFCTANAFKYVWRYMSKNGKTDISKAIWYLNKYLELNKD